MVIFEIWMLVQEKWVYLEGIFSGSADIRQLLPSESARFHSIGTEPQPASAHFFHSLVS
jgi:dynein heavy chain 1